MSKVVLWYQCSGENPIWSFCWDAAFGALQENIPIRRFESVEEIPNDPHNIVVGSVEECSKWLSMSGFEVPSEIGIEPSATRVPISKEDFLADFNVYPWFIKPKGTIKSFTGTVVSSKKDAELVLNWYDGDIWVSPVVNFLSEWRCYIHKGRILKVCNYAGDPNIYPDSDIVQSSVETYIGKLPHKAFVIDFGIVGLTRTIRQTHIIEGNDAWAIGNYGLDPFVYFNFLRDRWFQLTGLIK